MRYSLFLDASGVSHEILPRVRGLAYFRRGTRLDGAWNLSAEGGREFPASLVTLETWDDGSSKSALVDSRIDINPHSTRRFTLERAPASHEFKADPIVVEALTPGADGRITFGIHAEVEDATGREHRVEFVLSHEKIGLPLNSPSWITVLLAGSIPALRLSCYLVVGWGIDGRVCHFTTILAADQRERFRSVGVRRWTLVTRGVSTYPIWKDLWKIPPADWSSEGLRWNLIDPDNPATISAGAAQARELVAVFDHTEPEERERDYYEAIAWVRSPLYLAPTREQVVETKALGLFGGPGPPLKNDEEGTRRIFEEFGSYIGRNHFGPMGSGSARPWGTFPYSGTTGTPNNSPIPEPSLALYPTATLHELVKMRASYEAARRQHWRPLDWNPVRENRSTWRDPVPAGPLGGFHGEDFNPLDIEHPFFPAGSYVFALRGNVLHTWNLYNRAREILHEWTHGWNRNSLMPTRAEAWWIYMAALASDFFPEEEIADAAIERAILVGTQSYVSGHVEMGAVTDQYDYKDLLSRGRNERVWIESTWQVGNLLASLVGLWKKTRSEDVAFAATKVFRILSSSFFVADEWEPGHGGGWFSFYPSLETRDGGVTKTRISRGNLPSWVAPNGKTVAPRPDTGIDSGFVWTGVAALRSVELEMPHLADSDRVRAKEIDDWLLAHPGWIPNWVLTMKWREIPSAFHGRRV